MLSADQLYLCVCPFDMGSRKDKANKLAEEACEAFSAWEDFEASSPDDADGADSGAMLDNLCAECVDVIQAAVNLMTSCGATQRDISNAVVRVTSKNFVRGRYDKGGSVRRWTMPD